MGTSNFQGMNIANRQQGAALIVGLIVLVILTIIGMSSTSTTTNQLRMSSNLQTHNAGYQAASAVIRASLNDATSGLDWTLVTPQGPVAYLSTDNSSSAQAMVVYAGCRNVPTGYSLTKADSFKGVIHDINATGNALDGNGNTISTNRQVNGVQTVRPGCPSS